MINITIAEIIHRLFLSVARVFSNQIFGNNCDNGRIYITNTTAHQLNINKNAEILHQIIKPDLYKLFVRLP
jgi:hypothetical protein